MSDYFDRMSRCVNNPREVVELVRDQYRWYLQELSRKVLARDRDRLNKLINDFENIKDENPQWELERMHAFSHHLAFVNIKLRGRQRADGNPPIPCSRPI